MKKRRLLGILLSLALMMTMMLALSLTAYAVDATEYGVWIGDTQITSENLSGQGWSYDVASHTLTLNKFSYSGAGHQWDRNMAAIYAENDLAIQVKGTNTVECNAHSSNWVYGIYGEKKLTIDGDGILTFPTSGIDYSIATNNGDLTVDNATINTHGKLYGFNVSNGNIYIKGGSITSEDSSRANVNVSAGNLEISDATVNISGKAEGINVTGKTIINSGIVTSTSEEGNGICVFGKFEVNGGSVRTYSLRSSSIDADSLEMNGGLLEATGKGNKNGIYVDKGDAVINSGTVIASGRDGIYTRRSICINGGEVCATSLGKGIYASNDVTINRGAVIATGTDSGICADENVTVIGGDVEATATGAGASGIYAYNNVTIKGGNVTASGKSKGTYSGIAAKKKVIINDGTVTASSNYAGIVSVDSNDITVTGGSVKAIGGYDGIWSSDGKVAITGGNVSSVGKTDCGICSAEAIIGADAVSVESAGAKYAFAGYDDASDKYIGNKVKNSIVGTGWTDTEGTGEGEGIDINTAGRALNYKKVHFQTPPDTTPVGSVHNVSGSDYVVTAANTVSLVKAKSKKSITLPDLVTIDGKVFEVTGINAKAFKGTKVRTLTVKTKGLTKASVKGSLKGSKVRTVKVKVGKKKENKKFVKKYKKIFTKKNAGKKVSVRR